MNVLLLNLTRFGDLLQSQAAIIDLVRQGHRVGLVCLESFSGAVPLLDGVAHVASLPGALFLSGLDAAAGKDENGAPGWHTAVAGLSAWREELWSAFAPDIILNLTPSLSARLLALFLARGVPGAGYIVDEHGFGVNSNAWAAFLQGASLERGVSPFNMVDLFRRVAVPDGPAVPGLSSLRRPPGGSAEAMRLALWEQAPPECRGFVALQLGASENRRRWPVASFAQLGDALWLEEGLCPVILGSKAEQPLSERYAEAAAQPHISLCGKTGLTDLAAVLCEVSLLVTNDTGTMHLAAGLDRPVLAVFLATAQPFDTGPYREGSCSVEPDMDCHPCAFGKACGREEACRRAIRPELMTALALSRLRHGQWRTPEFCADDPGARVWLSRFDEQGFMSLRSLSGHGNGNRALWLELQRHYLRIFLDRKQAGAFKPEPWRRAQGLPKELCEAVRPAAQTAASLVRLLAQQGRVISGGRHGHMGDRFLVTWHKIHDLLRASPGFSALAVLWAQQTQAEGKDLPVILAAIEDFGALLEALVTELHE